MIIGSGNIYILPQYNHKLLACVTTSFPNKGNIMENFNTMFEVKLFLIDNERTMSWLARHCNVSPAAVKGWIDLKHYPSKKHRDAIYRVTGIRL